MNLRKRFDVPLYSTSAQLRRKTDNFKTDYTSIKLISVLPRNVVVSVVLSLHKPLTNAKLKHSRATFQFRRNHKLDTGLAQLFSESIARLSHVCVQKPQSCRSCGVYTAIGSDDGYLFYLQNCCLFIHRPRVLIP